MPRPPMVPANIVAGLRGPTGLPGPGAVPADEAVAAYVAGPSETADALDTATGANLADTGSATGTALDAATGTNLADTDSDTYAAAAAEFVPDPKAPLAGKTLRIYGDSWAAGLGLGAGNSFGQKAGEDHGITTTNNAAISGSAGASIADLMLATLFSTLRWDEGDADALVICAGLNDSRFNELTDPANVRWVNALRNSMRVAVALALGQQRVGHADASWSTTGLWTNAPYSWCSNGTNVSACQLPGGTRTVAFEGDEIAIVCGGLYTQTHAVVDFYLDGEKVRTIRFHDDTDQYPSATNLIGWHAERFTGLTPGPHTLKLVKSDDTTDAVYVDSYILPADSPPMVVLCREPALPAATYTDPAFAPYDQGSPESTKAAGKIVDDVATEFPGVRLCTLPELIPITDFQADEVHPNTLGRDKLRAALNLVLNPPALPARVDDLTGGGRVQRAVKAPKRTDVARFRLVSLAAYQVPEGAIELRIRCLGGGGGGGSGRRGAAASVRCGGGAGAGAGFDVVELSTYGLPRSLYVTAGNGGAAGAAVTADDTNGNDGVAGLASYVVTDNTLPADESIWLAYAPGGARGRGATTTPNGLGGAAAASRTGLSGPGAAASTTGGAGVTTTGNGYGGTGQGGGSGGGITTANASGAGGAGWWSSTFLTTIIAAPAGGANTGGAGGTGVPTTRIQGRLVSEASGGGGGANLSGAGGTGGAGGRGSGGGGGGASVNGNNSGAGGAGGDGFVEITAYF